MYLYIYIHCKCIISVWLSCYGRKIRWEKPWFPLDIYAYLRMYVCISKVLPQYLAKLVYN